MFILGLEVISVHRLGLSYRHQDEIAVILFTQCYVVVAALTKMCIVKVISYQWQHKLIGLPYSNCARTGFQSITRHFLRKYIIQYIVGITLKSRRHST